MLPLAANLDKLSKPHMKPVCVICQLIRMSSKYFKKCSNFYSAVWISQANFILPKKFCDISSVKMTNRNNTCSDLSPNSHKSLIRWCIFVIAVSALENCKAQQGWSSRQARHHMLLLGVGEITLSQAVKNKRKRLMLSEDRDELHIYHVLSTSCYVQHLNLLLIKCLPGPGCTKWWIGWQQRIWLVLLG